MKKTLFVVALLLVALVSSKYTKQVYAQVPSETITHATEARSINYSNTGLIDSSQKELASPEPQAAAAKVPVIVKVEEGDTLIKIAQQHGTTFTRLFDANPQIANPDIINPNDEITIPSPDDQLAIRPLPQPVAKQVEQPAAATSSLSAKSKANPAPVYAAGSTVWDQLAKCESGGNWAINTGNGFYGGLQFTLSTWHAVGGSGYPNEASREEQIARAEVLLARSGWGQWPACTSKLGLR